MSFSEADTILLVDDRPATRYSTARVLRNARFRVIEAVSGTEALEQVNPDIALVVLDVNLPDINGREVCRLIRQRTDVARLPVIHLSATFISDDNKIRGLEAGADGYLTHPVDPLVLVATIKAFLRARQMEAELIRSEAKFRAVFDYALTGICLLSDDMTYLDVNPSLCQMLRRDRHQIVGQSCNAFVAPDADGLIRDIDIQVSTHGGWRGLVPMIRSDGERVQLEWSVSLHSSPNIRLAVITDITERERILTEREQLLESERAARKAAETANRLKDEFLATLSHELRTPLNAIVGWSEVLQMRPPSTAELAEGLATIERNAKVQAELINDLLDVSRIISGKLRLNQAWVDPSAIVLNSLAAVVPTANAHGITIEEILPEGRKPIWGDASRLQQVVWNLVNNAVKFTPSGGRVCIELQQSVDSLQVRVSDTGKGIKPEFLDQIFERFRQEEGGSTRSYGGLGLGLAIVRHIVELHGGTVTAQSPGEGRGALFVVTLPQPARTPLVNVDGPIAVLAESASRTRQPLELAGVRILIVDDDHDARQVAVRVLRECNAEVVDAETVVFALQQVQKFKPHVLVSDIGMPMMDGYDLIRILRAQGHDHTRLPAIAMTAFARDEDRAHVIQAGYQAHISKPFAPTELAAKIVDVLKQSHEEVMTSGRQNRSDPVGQS